MHTYLPAEGGRGVEVEEGESLVGGDGTIERE